MCGLGAFAEYVCVPENAIALKPVNMSFEEAAAVAESAIVALQGLRDKGKIQARAKGFDQWCVGWCGYVCGADCQIVRGCRHSGVQHAEFGHGALDWGRSCH